MLVEKILKIPPVIDVKVDSNTYSFEFIIFINGYNDLRFAYVLTSHRTWYNIFNDNRSESWLYLQEKIENDTELMQFVDELFIFLQKHNLL